MDRSSEMSELETAEQVAAESGKAELEKGHRPLEWRVGDPREEERLNRETFGYWDKCKAAAEKHLLQLKDANGQTREEQQESFMVNELIPRSRAILIALARNKVSDRGTFETRLVEQLRQVMRDAQADDELKAEAMDFFLRHDLEFEMAEIDKQLGQNGQYL